MTWPRYLSERSAGIACLTLVAVVALAYSNALDGPFIFDDIPSIQQNLSLRRWEQGWPVIHDIPGVGATVQGRPVLNLSFALNYAVGELNVREYHATNIAIHALAALVLFGLVRFTLRRPSIPVALSARGTGVALATALVWALHPLQTESVTYTVQRAESLAGLWYLLTLYTFACGATAARPRPWYAAAVVCCALGMGTKEVVVSAPLAVLLYDRAFLAGSFGAALRGRWWLYLGLAATWVLLAVLVLTAGGRGGTAGFGSAVSAVAYARSQPVFILRYLRLVVWPDPLVLDYGVDVVTDPWEYGPAAVVVVALAAVALWAVIRRPRVGLPCFLFFALLAPTSSVVPVATQTAAEHRMYLPLAALVVLAVVGSVVAADRLARAQGANAAVGAWAVVAVLLSVVTHARNADYRTERGMWEDVAAKRPGSARAATWVAMCAEKANDLDIAEREYCRAIQLAPSRTNWQHFGTFLLHRGRIEDARRAFDEAVRADSDGDGYAARALFEMEIGDLVAALRDVEESIVRGQASYPLRAQIHARAGRIPLALADFNRSIELDPTEPVLYAKRGQLRSATRDHAGAVADFSEALKLNPEEPNYYASRAENSRALGKLDLAFADLDTAIRMAPRPRFFYLRSDLLREQGRFDDAIADLTRAIADNPDGPEAYLARAQCYAQKQRLDLARTDLLHYQKLGGQLDEQTRNFLSRARP